MKLSVKFYNADHAREDYHGSGTRKARRFGKSEEVRQASDSALGQARRPAEENSCEARPVTIEKRIVAGIADIKAVSLACSKCGAKVSFSPDKPIQIPRICPQCGAAWASEIKPRHEIIESASTTFLESLVALRTVMNSETFRILLEFEEQALPSRHQ